MVAEVSNATEFIKPITVKLTELTRVEMSEEERFKQSMRKLAARLVELQDRARSLGVPPGDRELLECSHCGLMEDGTSITTSAASCSSTWRPGILDRFLQAAEILEITGKSYRLRGTPSSTKNTPRPEPPAES